MADKDFGLDPGPKPPIFIRGDVNAAGDLSVFSTRVILCRAVISLRISQTLGTRCWDLLVKDRDGPAALDIRGINTDDQQLKRFVTVWNALQKRTTTKPEDLFVILANLLNFNPSHLLEVPSKEIFQTIISSLTWLPQTLLFNTGNRLDECRFHQNRWLPVELSSLKLQDDSWMDFTENGISVLPSGNCPHQSPGSILITPPLVPTVKSIILRCSDPDRCQSDIFLQLDLFRQAGDTFPSLEYEATLIVIEQEVLEQSTTQWKAACMQVSKYDRRIIGYHCKEWSCASKIIPHYFSRCM